MCSGQARREESGAHRVLPGPLEHAFDRSGTVCPFCKLEDGQSINIECNAPSTTSNPYDRE